MAKKKEVFLDIAGREVRVSSPDKPYFPDAGHSKLDIVNYYRAIGEGALRGVHNRPMVLRRYVRGIRDKAFFQKRAPKGRPEWVDVVTISFPSGRKADEIVVTDLAQLIWVVNLGCLDLNPHPVRADDLEHPDELRVDLDPNPGVDWDDVRRVALITREVLEEHGLTAWPKTSGSRGLHVYARIEPRWGFDDVRRAALAVAREVERRAPKLASSAWWKEERHGVFLDYNQNAKDRTVASAYSVRPLVDARVSAPLRWDEVPDCDPADFNVVTMPKRFEELGDIGAGIDDTPGSLEPLLELVERHEAEGMGDAAWPPHYKKKEDEPPRAPPSKRSGAKRKGGAKRKSKSGRRKPKFPLLTIAQAEYEDDAKAGLERWKAKYPEVAPHLAVDDVLVDAMRGRSSTWTRIRVNLRHVPEELRPPQEAPDPDYDPWEGYREEE